MNNGHATPFFKVERGIRQGCPISALLFILVVEVMANNIRKTSNIKGIQFRNIDIRITQLADDTTLFLKDRKSLENVLNILNHLHRCSGLKLNKSKTEVINLGITNNICLKHLGIKQVSSTKSLGITIMKNYNETAQYNIQEKLVKVENLINMWRSRNLTIKGKITLLKSKVIPLFLYTASVFYIPQDAIDTLDKLLYSFIWPSGKHHVKKDVLIQNIDDGGLAMPHIESIIKGMKLTWIKRFLQSDRNYSQIAQCMSHVDDFSHFFSHNTSVDLMILKPTLFYKQIIDYWQELKSVDKTVNDILNEKLHCNKNIVVGGKPIAFRTLNANNKIILKDILNPNNTLKTRQNLVNEGFNLSIMEYNSLVSCIPKHWLKKIKNSSSTFVLIDDCNVKVNGQYKHFNIVTCKDYCKEFVSRKVTVPTALRKWEDEYFYVNFDWSCIFCNPYSSCRETAAQSLQYQIIHRYFPCQERLSVWYDYEDKHCVLCSDIVDSIEHYFFNCTTVNNMWREFSMLFRNTYDMYIQLGCLDVIFGLANALNDNTLSVLNFCILQGKMYVKNSKRNQEVVSLAGFKEHLKKRIAVEKYILELQRKTDVFAIRYEPLYIAL
jgi:hypothetical protein